MQPDHPSPDEKPEYSGKRTPYQRLRHARQERERKARRRAENRLIVSRSRARGCFLCGAPDPEHHHLSGKTKKAKVCHLVSRSTRAVLDEISLTLLLCRKCHGDHHKVDALRAKWGGAA